MRQHKDNARPQRYGDEAGAAAGSGAATMSRPGRFNGQNSWTGQPARVQPVPALPTDRPRGAIRPGAAAVCSRLLESGRRDALCRLALRYGGGLEALLLSAWQVLQGRLTDCTAALVGVRNAESGRWLPFGTQWSAQTQAAEHIAAAASELALAAQDGHWLDQQAADLPHPQAWFTWLHDPASVQAADEAPAGAELHLVAAIGPGRMLQLRCAYDAGLFDAATVECWLDSYLALLEAYLADAAQPLVRLSCLPAPERHMLLHGLNATTTDYPRDRCVHHLFEQQAALRPQAPAVQFGAARLSYAELDRRANQLAHRLLQCIGSPGGLVGILVRRSPDLVVALLATLKAGCAYVPLDPAHPPARQRLILEQARIRALITGEVPCALPLDPAVPVIHLVEQRRAIAAAPDAPPVAACSAEDLAYVIFTSGSTGVPKGVEITHRAVVNLLCSMAQEPGLAADDVLLAGTTISFDIAALELFLPLAVGARLVIASRREAGDGAALKRRLKRSGATVFQATPSSWNMLLEAGFSGASLRRLLCGGEPLPRELARRLLAQGGELWNMYGPSETTVWSSCSRVAEAAPITVGSLPIANTRFYLLDRQGEPVPVGVPAELYIGGDGLARGYLGQPQRSAEAFVPNPFGEGRLYRTGDLARRLPGGGIQLLGRIDRQIKLRGFRIEPDEIESALLRGRVAAAAVECRPDPAGGARLVAYFVPKPERPRSAQELRALLAAELPDYMVPTAWMALDRLPLTPSGKIDRAALPMPQPLASADYAAPGNAVEAALTAIWADVLKAGRIGVHADLLELGADSIQLFRITALARRAGLQLSVRQLLQHRTVARLAQALAAQAELKPARAPQPEASDEAVAASLLPSSGA
jgi:amino acid adenylation domain-containing protein